MSDYISSLSDDILCKILEQLKTSEAVRTCVLAKRWNNMWTSLPILEIWYRNSTAKPIVEGIISLLHKIKDAHIMEFLPICHLHHDLLPQELPEIHPRFENLTALTVVLCFYSYFEMQNWIIESCPKLTNLVLVQHQSCLCDGDFEEWQKTLVPVPLVEAFDRRDLQMVEVKFCRFDIMVRRAIQYLMFGKGELRNFRHDALVVNGRIDQQDCVACRIKFRTAEGMGYNEQE